MLISFIVVLTNCLACATATTVKSGIDMTLQDTAGSFVRRSWSHIFSGLLTTESNGKLAPAPAKVFIPEGSSAEYIQSVAYGKDQMCQSQPYAGYAIKMNTCLYVGDFNASRTSSSPIYALAYDTTNSMTGSVNVSVWNVTTCSGPPIDNFQLQYSTVGCIEGMQGDPEVKNVRSAKPSYPNWPTGEGYSLGIAAHVADCTSVPMVAPLSTQYSSYFGMCHNITYDFKGANQSNIGFTVNSCSGNNIVISVFTGGTNCQGTPIDSNLKIKATSQCGQLTYLQNMGVGNLAFSCLAGVPKHNKCYNAIGMSTPPCEISATKSAVKWTCMKSGYSTCAITEFEKNDAAGEFGCCY